MIPDFTSDGTLPPGIHEGSWDEFVNRFATNPHRRHLLAGLKEAALSLKHAGCRRIFVGGSYVTTKESPADFDACWDMTGVDPTHLDPILLIFDPGRAAQKAKYGGELFLAQATEQGCGKIFLDFFMTKRDTGGPKGIVAINLEEVSR